MAQITRRTTADGSRRCDVRWNTYGLWQTKTFARRVDADAFRRKVDADELRGMVVDVRRSSQKSAIQPAQVSRRDAELAAKLQIGAEEAQARGEHQSHR